MEIPPPDPNRPPLKRNLFTFLREANCTLIPLFPYLDAGSMVPAATLFENGPDAYFGFFEHENDVDEIFVCLASEGSRIPSGSVRVGTREHFVGSPFKEGAPLDAFALVLIVQRQAESGLQHERVTFKCGRCFAELLSQRFDGAAPAAGDDLALFATLPESLAIYTSFNAGDRTCPRCGTMSPPFPISRWGQDAYVSRTATVRRARALHAAQAGGTP